MNDLYLTLKITKMSEFEPDDIGFYADRVAKFVASGFPVEDVKCIKVKKGISSKQKANWELVKKGNDFDVFECTKCHKRIRIYPDDNIEFYPFCVCGRKMVKNALKQRLRLLCFRRNAVGKYPAYGADKGDKLKELARIDELIVDAAMKMFVCGEEKDERY